MEGRQAARITGGEILEASEIIELKASATGDASAQLSILEIS